MPPSWLYQIDAHGLLVTPDIMERVRAGDRAALRAINRQPLTKLYRASYSRPRRSDAIGLFWADVPPLEHVPLVRGRYSPAALLKDYVTYEDEQMTKREAKQADRTLKHIHKHPSPDEYLAVKWTDKGRKVVATIMKPNPKFDLVVVKSPHCQQHMFAAWCGRLINVDAPGSTSANLPTLGHTRCRRTGTHAPFERAGSH